MDIDRILKQSGRPSIRPSAEAHEPGFVAALTGLQDAQRMLKQKETEALRSFELKKDTLYRYAPKGMIVADRIIESIHTIISELGEEYDKDATHISLLTSKDYLALRNRITMEFLESDYPGDAQEYINSVLDEILNVELSTVSQVRERYYQHPVDISA